MITRQMVVDEARTWLGTPWHRGASLKGVGCDCIGIAIGVGRTLGLPEAEAFAKDIRFRGYSQQPNPRLLLQACDEYLDRIPISEGRLGDLALARVQVDPQHFCILSNDDPQRVIHSYIQMGKVVENIVDDNWRAHVLRMFRFRGVE